MYTQKEVRSSIVSGVTGMVKKTIVSKYLGRMLARCTVLLTPDMASWIGLGLLLGAQTFEKQLFVLPSKLSAFGPGSMQRGRTACGSTLKRPAAWWGIILSRSSHFHN